MDRISIHALHEESDASYPAGSRWTHVFQSTLSMRRATAAATALTLSGCLFQSTLSMRRATPSLIADAMLILISIHALHEESDHIVSPPAAW